jgi:hypothetical protein
MLASISWLMPSFAQAPLPSVEVAREVRLSVGETRAFAMSISPRDAAPEGSWIGIASPGLKLVFSAGSPLPRGWRLAPGELSGLTVTATDKEPGRSTLVILLLDKTGEALARATSTVVLEPARSEPIAAAITEPPPGRSTAADERGRAPEERAGELAKAGGADGVARAMAEMAAAAPHSAAVPAAPDSLAKPVSPPDKEPASGARAPAVAVVVPAVMPNRRPPPRQ